MDDHESICTLLSQYALAQGFDCQSVLYGKDALRALETEHFDVVLLDVMLPDIDGTQVRQAIRACSSIPIIMISAKTDEHETRIDGHEIRLTPKEESLLILLASHPGQIMNRQQLMESAWQYDSDTSDRAVDTHVKRLRAKLDTVAHPGFKLETIWGMGYRIARVEEA